MAKSPSTEAVDAAIAAVVAPTLKQRGFRRQRRHWWLATPEVVKVVTVLSHRLNTATDTMFTIELGFSYPGLGEAAPQRWEAAYCAHCHRIGQVSGDGTDLWWRFDAINPSEVGRTTASVREVWERDGLPFLDGCTDPRALLDRFVRSGKLTLELADLSLRLGDREPAELAVGEYLDHLRGYDPGKPSPYNRHPETHLLGPYSVVTPLVRRLGQQLPAPHRQRVVDAFATARVAAAEGDYVVAPGRNTELLRELAREVGVDASFIGS